MYTVVTTVQPPNECMRQWSGKLIEAGSGLVVIGDRKGPAAFELSPADFYCLERQSQLGFTLAPLLPEDHYARKNLGYLVAMRRGADCIYETDDDNAPGATWQPREHTVRARRITGGKWFNAYRTFSDELVWPRGFPLGRIADPDSYRRVPEAGAETIHAPIQQGLADQSPDVDAVWRLVFDRELRFRGGPSIHLPPGTWSPFNSQSTWWWPAAYPLMYLPSFCSFRMTDIWRGFVAQRCLWALNAGLVFHAPEVLQQRNPHDLMRDFEDELPGYLGNERLVDVLASLSLEAGVGQPGKNLQLCYQALVEAGFCEERELVLVAAWLDDLHGIETGQSPSR